MPQDEEQATERTKLLYNAANDRRLSAVQQETEARSVIGSHVSKDELALHNSPVGERLPYNDYTTIDWLHDLVRQPLPPIEPPTDNSQVKSSYRYRSVHSKPGFRYAIVSTFEDCSGWIAAAIIGIFAACVAFLVDIAEATVSDWKLGYCKTNVFSNRESCCTDRAPLGIKSANLGQSCEEWHMWTDHWYRAFAVFVGFALLYGVISSSLTMTTKSNLPAAAPGHAGKQHHGPGSGTDQTIVGKSMYLAAGSGIPEIKTILSGFVIPHFLDFKVLFVKAVGAVFAVATGMCLGKEGPFVHISTCVAYLVGMRFPKYRDNGRKLRELLSAGCSSGLSVAFGAPIGGVLFSYEVRSQTFYPLGYSSCNRRLVHTSPERSSGEHSSARSGPR